MTNEEFAEIINETKAIVLSSVEKHLAYSEAVDDVVQETYFRAYNSLVKKKFREESKLSTWLYAIAKNESLRMNKKLEKEEKKQKKWKDSIHKDVTQTLYGDSLDIENWLKKLPEKYSEVLSLVIRGYSEKEISKELSIPKGTVKSRLFRAKEQLQQILNKEESI